MKNRTTEVGHLLPELTISPGSEVSADLFLIRVNPLINWPYGSKSAAPIKSWNPGKQSWRQNWLVRSDFCDNYFFFQRTCSTHLRLLISKIIFAAPACAAAAAQAHCLENPILSLSAFDLGPKTGCWPTTDTQIRPSWFSRKLDQQPLVDRSLSRSYGTKPKKASKCKITVTNVKTFFHLNI